MSRRTVRPPPERLRLIAPGEPDALRRALRNRNADGASAFNLRKDPVDFRDRFYEPRPADVPPRKMPARNLLHVRDQGVGTDTCTAHALAAVIDFTNRRRALDYPEATPFEPVSTVMLFEMARHFDEMPANAMEGSSLRGALKGLFHNGVCSERIAGTQPIGWRLTLQAAEEARGTALGAFFRLRHVLYDYHAALCETDAIAVSAMIHNGWKQVGRGADAVIGPDDGKPKQEAHAFAIVGYTPDGFMIQNSYGTEWGDGGLALWPYEDWSRNVLDAWVLWLAAPSRKAFRLVGGHVGLQGRTPLRSRAVVPRLEITGHYLHFEDGEFVRTGPYHNSIDTIEETARLLTEADRLRPGGPRYDHLLLMVDSGLDSIEDMTARAAVLTPIYKAHRIYPLFVFWHSDMLARVLELLEGHAPQARKRAGEVTAYLDHLLEVFMAQHARAVWQSAGWEAARLAYDGRHFQEGRADAPRVDYPKAPWKGEAWHALSTLAAAVLDRRSKRAPMRLHLAAHGAGVFLLGHLVARAMSDATVDRTIFADAVATVSLLAPACPDAFFQAAFGPLQAVLAARSASQQPTAIYTLNADRENQDRVGPYGRSFLNMIKGAFNEDDEGVLGLDPVRTALQGVETVLAGPLPGRRCDSRSHLGFAEDPTTLDDIAWRILSAEGSNGRWPDRAVRSRDAFAPFGDALGS